MDLNIQNDEVITSQYPDYKTEIADILHSNLTPKLMREQLLSYHEYDISAALDLLTADVAFVYIDHHLRGQDQRKRKKRG